MRSTFSRLFISMVILQLIALLLIGSFFQLLVRNYLTNKEVDKLKNDAKVISELAGAYHSEGSVYNMEFLLNLNVASSVSGANAVICDSHGKILLCSDSLRGCEHQGQAITDDYLQKVLANDGSVDTGVIQGLYTENRFVVSVPITSASGNHLGIVIVSSPMESTVSVLERIRKIFLSVSLSVTVLSAVFITVFSRKQARPLQDMAKAATDFGHGNLTARVRTDGRSSREVEELALAFNNMASSLQKSEYQRQQFVANVSHELKTPMTTIGGYVDGILDGTIAPEQSRQCLQIVSEETKRLSRLVRSMLDISQLQDQGGIPEEKKTQFDLEEALGRVLITFEQKINSKNLDVEVDMPEHPVYTLAEQDYISQVIYNLMDNAVKFSPEGETLGLSIREGGSKAYISITNAGPTIPPEELPLVFDRFHKLDKSRSLNRDGWGLGLHIVKTIVCSHGENISVTSRDGKTTFTFTMPLVN